MLSKTRTILTKARQIKYSTYKSAISLDKLYPNSSLKLFTPNEVTNRDKSNEKFTGYIPIDKLQFDYNGSALTMSFHVESSEWISADVRKQLLSKYKTSITNDGRFVLKSDLTHFKLLNNADVLEKLRNIIRRLEAK